MSEGEQHGLYEHQQVEFDGRVERVSKDPSRYFS